MSSNRSVIILSVYISGGGTAFHASLDCETLVKWRDAVIERGGTNADLKPMRRSLAEEQGRHPCHGCYPGAR